MRRVLIIGPPGAGKSTLGRQLAGRLDLPLVHLDQLFWGEGWVQRPEESFRRDLDAALAGNAWVIDGNYASSLARRMERADTIIYLDFPTRVCLWRVLRRSLRDRGKTRPDMAPGCPEQFDREFFRYVRRFRRDVRPEVEKILAAGHSAQLVRVRGCRQLRRWYLDIAGDAPQRET